MSLAILGLGTTLPATIVTQEEALRIHRRLCPDAPADRLALLYRQTGIRTRRTALGGAVVRDLLDGTAATGSPFLSGGAGPTTRQRMEHYAALAPPLAVAAARSALDRSGLDAAALTHVVTVSCTGFLAPGLDAALIRALGLAATVERTHVGFMGCHGAINGLRVARAFTAAEPGCPRAGGRRRVVQPASGLRRRAAADDRQRSVRRRRRGRGRRPPAAAPAGAWRVAAAGSCLLPDSADAMAWTVGDHGFAMTLARRVPELIARHVRPWLEHWLAGQGVALAEVASWALHPGGPRILSAVEEALGLSPEAAAPSRAVFAECGNMSSPTLLFILDRLRTAAAPRPCVALGFGPGLVAEALLLL